MCLPIWEQTLHPNIMTLINQRPPAVALRLPRVRSSVLLLGKG